MTLCPRCRALAERAGLTHAGGDMTEKAMLAAIHQVARPLGWLMYHTFDARKSPEGFPDVVLAHPQRPAPIWCVELKTARGKPSAAQTRWLHALAQATGIHAALVRPDELRTLCEALGP